MCPLLSKFSLITIQNPLNQMGRDNTFLILQTCYASSLWTKESYNEDYLYITVLVKQNVSLVKYIWVLITEMK